MALLRPAMEEEEAAEEGASRATDFLTLHRRVHSLLALPQEPMATCKKLWKVWHLQDRWQRKKRHRPWKLFMNCGCSICRRYSCQSRYRPPIRQSSLPLSH